jgi:2-iminobutanoate/2-iminopropanoate deaminase
LGIRSDFQKILYLNMKTLITVLVLFTLSIAGFTQQKQIIQTSDAPAAIGPYSQAVKANGFVYVAGQLGVDSVTGSLATESFKAEVKQVMENIKAILEASGSGMKDIVNTTVFLTDLSGFSLFNEIYGSYFTENFPARTTVGVASLPKNASVEIAVVALAKD